MTKVSLPSKPGMWFTNKGSVSKPPSPPPVNSTEDSGVLKQIQAQEFTD